ncbi:hypothetical protein TCAP_02653 [Tolypocladium capitatum]|uniref:Uncharacterized protein n=1 Tax=Tolypocladium capitatum TaxID=45235 RepID=A0A2K3QIR3_9HYPO|nr:hypothetical protein TCAP_02653 [Tolypocladium capitatum]
MYGWRWTVDSTPRRVTSASEDGPYPMPCNLQQTRMRPRRPQDAVTHKASYAAVHATPGRENDRFKVHTGQGERGRADDSAGWGPGPKGKHARAVRQVWREDGAQERLCVEV